MQPQLVAAHCMHEPSDDALVPFTGLYPCPGHGLHSSDAAWSGLDQFAFDEALAAVTSPRAADWQACLRDPALSPAPGLDALHAANLALEAGMGLGCVGPARAGGLGLLMVAVCSGGLRWLFHVFGLLPTATWLHDLWVCVAGVVTVDSTSTVGT